MIAETAVLSFAIQLNLTAAASINQRPAAEEVRPLYGAYCPMKIPTASPIRAPQVLKGEVVSADGGYTPDGDAVLKPGRKTMMRGRLVRKISHPIA